MENKWKIAVVVALVIAIVGMFTPLGQSVVSTLGNTTASFWDTTGGYRVGGTEVISSTRSVIVEGFQQGGAATVLTDANGGTYTLTEAELIASGTLEFAAGGSGQEVIALTFPATSTMTTLIPNAGDCRTWLYDSSALAAATTTTLTAGAGHIVIAPTANDDLIDGNEYSQIRMCRRTDTDVTTALSAELVDVH